MLLVVTGVGFLIHVYSVGYMHGEEGFTRFFTYMNLFMVSMLLLVMGNNYVGALHRVGRRRALLLSPHRLLLRQACLRPKRRRKPSS